MGVLAIGGFFFRANDPDTLAAWYQQVLGVGSGCAAEGAGEPYPWSWKTLGGPVVFAPFKRDTDYFLADKAFMLNLRVADLSGMLERLQTLGVAVETRAEWDDPLTGRFARIHDPDGNPIELWEPPAGSL